MEYLSYEKEIIEKLLDYDNQKFLILREQIKNSIVIKRESSTAWFFTDILVDKTKVDSIKTTSNQITFWDIDLLSEGRMLMWFIIFINDWYITLLEWYTFDNSFEEIDFKYCTIAYDWGKERKIPDELR